MKHSPDVTDGAAPLSRQHAKLLALARHLAHDSEADDLVQETWVAALRAGIEHALTRPAWLQGVLRRQALLTHRARGRRLEREETTARPEAQVDEVPELEAGQVRAKLVAAVEALGEPERTVIRLRYLDGLTVPQVAARLDRSRNTVKMQLRRGLERLRARLDRELGGRRERWALALAGARARGDEPAAPQVPARVSARVALFAGAALVTVSSGAAWLALDSSNLHFPAAEAPRVAALVREPSAANPDVAGADTAGRVPARATGATGTPGSAEPDGSTRSWMLRVEDPDGRPLPGARVYFNGRRRSETTDASGEVRLVASLDEPNELAQEFLPDTVTFFAEHPGFLATSFHHVDGAAPLEALTLRFRHAARTVTGIVRSRAGKPLAGIGVGLFDQAGSYRRRPDGVVLTSPESRAVTDAGGRFEVAGHVAPGVILRVEGAGWAPLAQEVSQAPLSSGSSGLLEVVLDPGLGLEGTVRDADGGVLAGARIEYSTLGGTIHHEVVTDERGDYACRSLPPGELFLWAFHPRLEGRFASTAALAVNGEPLSWSPTLRDHRAFRIRVVEAGGAPAPGLLCQLQTGGWFRSQETDADGRTPPFPTYPDDPVLVVVRDAYLEHSMPLLILEDRRLTGDDLEVSLPPGAREVAELRGSLVADDGGPLAPPYSLLLCDATRELAMPWFELDEETGSFRAAPQPPGEYALYVVTPGHGIAELPPFTLAPGTPLDLGALVLPRTGLAAVEVGVGVPGDARAGETFLAVDRVRQVGSQTTWISGPQLVVGEEPLEVELFPGRYRFGAWRQDGVIGAREVEVRADGRVRVELGRGR